MEIAKNTRKKINQTRNEKLMKIEHEKEEENI